MKIFNIFASMLALTMISSLSASNQLSDELTVEESLSVGTTGPTPTHPIPYRDAGDTWPKTPEEGNMRLWKPLWDTKEGILDAFSRGINNLCEAFSWNNEKPVTIKDRFLDVLAASARLTLDPAVLAILFPITYCNADSKGEWTVTVIDNSGQPAVGNSFLQNLLEATFKLSTLPATVVDRVSTNK